MKVDSKLGSDRIRGSIAGVSTTRVETTSTERNDFSIGAGRNPTLTEQQKISSPAMAVASVPLVDFLLQCESAFRSGQCSAAFTAYMNDWQYATHIAPPAFKQTNATTNNAASRIFIEWTYTELIMTVARNQKCDLSHPFIIH